MHYLYLPVVMPDVSEFRLPDRLAFLGDLLTMAVNREFEAAGTDWSELYVYVTARRGWASPGNPLNRPGWHTDGFGTNDINYIWTDRYPTRFAEQAFNGISTDHVRSAEQFEEQVKPDRIRTYDDGTLFRLDSTVVHATPIIPAPGGNRSFLKISFSPDKYNLLGNSHNHLFDYSWKMWDRAVVRNDPAYAGGDAGPQEDAS
jgi:hypothetical protein